MKRLLYKTLAIFIGFALAIGLGEVAARIYKFQKYSSDTILVDLKSKLVYMHKPSITFINKHGIEITYNSLGFIGKEIGPKQSNVFRILGIGDSIMAGVYLPEDERFINQAASILEEKAKKKIETVNAGVAGYNTWQELELIRTKGMALRPELIIVGVCLNDYCGYRPRLRKGWFGRVVEVPVHHKKARYFNYLYEKSELYQFLYDALYKLKKSFKEKKSYLEEFDYKPDFQTWEKPLKDMIELAKANETKILFVIFPLEKHLLEESSITFEPLSRFFLEENVYFLDLIKSFNANSGKTLFLKRDPVHPNTLGHRIAAEAISDYIIERGLLDG